jgi:GT2 family glycosyltransferase
MMRMKISVIIASLGRFDDLLRTVKALLDSENVDYEIVVADQNPSWPTDRVHFRDQLRGNPRVKWLNFGRIGVVKARNLAVRESKGEILVFVDDDVLIGGPRFLSEHAAIYRDETIAAATGRELDGRTMGPADNETWWKDTPQSSPPRPAARTSNRVMDCLSFDRQGSDYVVDVCHFCTCNGSIRRRIFLAVKGFDENFGGNSYGDDYDLALRLNKCGYRIAYLPTAILIHLRSPIGGLRVSDPANPSSHYEKSLSRMIFYLRYRAEGPRLLMSWQALRTTILMRSNFSSIWTFLAACSGTWLAYKSARKIAYAETKSSL